MAVPAEYKAVSSESRARLDKLLAQQGAAARLKRLYEEAEAALVKRIYNAAGRGDTMSSSQMKAMLGQVREGQKSIAARLAGHMGDESEAAQEVALSGLVEDIGRLEKQFTGAATSLPIEEAGKFRGIVGGRRQSLVRAHKTSFARYGADLVEKMEDSLSRSLLTGETPRDAAMRLTEVADVEWYRAERLVRTELAWAANATALDGMKEMGKDMPDLMARWCEHVDDGSGMPLDDRVGVDSLAMHGQVAEPGGVFVMPPLSLVPDKSGTTVVSPQLVGKTWQFPPNRPNDRAVIQPFRPGWGVPGWRLVGGRRVEVKEAQEPESKKPPPPEVTSPPSPEEKEQLEPGTTFTEKARDLKPGHVIESGIYKGAGTVEGRARVTAIEKVAGKKGKMDAVKISLDSGQVIETHGATYLHRVPTVKEMDANWAKFVAEQPEAERAALRAQREAKKARWREEGRLARKGGSGVEAEAAPAKKRGKAPPPIPADAPYSHELAFGTVSDSFTGKAAKLTSEGQTATRSAASRIVQEAGLTPRGRALDAPGRHVLEVMPDKEMNGAQGFANQDGSLTLARSEMEHLRAGSEAMRTAEGRARLAGGFRSKDPQAVAQLDSIGTLVHETIHTMSPLKPGARQGLGLLMEEVTTEVSARGIVADAVGLEYRDVAYKGAYQAWIDDVSSAVQRVAGKDMTPGQVRDRVLHASKAARGGAADKHFETDEEFAAHWAAQVFPSDVGKQEALVAQLRKVVG